MEEHHRIVGMQIGWCKEQIKELRPFLREHKYICVYCGDHSTCKDHLLPKPWTGSDLRKYVPTVPACSECNLILSDKVIPTITERAMHVAAMLRIRYRKLLEMPAWSDKSMVEMGYNLQSSIRSSELRRRSGLVPWAALGRIDVGG